MLNEDHATATSSLLSHEDGSKDDVNQHTPGAGKPEHQTQHDGREIEYLTVAGPLLPLFIQEGAQNETEEEETLWVAKWQRAPEYLGLLYDLAIASVLSVFGDTHSTLTGSDIISYFSYFIIIWWVWASQVVYDCRFQANDWTHRLFKFLQLGAFVYIGVFSEKFDPTLIIWPGDYRTPEEVNHYTTANCWKGAALAYALSRFLLAVQYAYVAAITRSRNDRRERWASFAIPIVTCLLTAIAWLIAGLLSRNATAKLVLGYGSLLMEVAVTVASSGLEKAIAPSSEVLAHRFADLTLVILAEGVLGIVKTLASVVSGFGVHAGRTILNGYAQCISALVIVFGTWHFIFHAFDEKQRFRNKRTSLLWAFLHLPLHFGILLLLSSMNGVAIYENLYGAVNMLTNDYVQALGLPGYTQDNTQLDSLLSPETIFQFNKLEQDTPLETEINRLNNETITLNNYLNSNGSTNSTIAPPTADPYIESLKYFSTVMWSAGQSYGVSFGEDAAAQYYNLTNTSAAWVGDIQNMIHQEEIVQTTYLNYCRSYTIDIAAPAQIFLPAAGGVIIIAVLLTVFRINGIPASEQQTSEIWKGYQRKTVEEEAATKTYRTMASISQQRWRTGIAIFEWLPSVLHSFVGVALCLCGFLDIPANTLTSPLDNLLYVGWAFAICYGGLMISDVIILAVAREARGGGFMRRIDENDVIRDGASLQTSK